MFSSYVKIPEGKATKSRLQRKPGWLLDLLSSKKIFSVRCFVIPAICTLKDHIKRKHQSVLVVKPAI